MSAESERLYEEFLEHYELEKGLYMHPIELMDHPFEKVDELKVVYFGDVMIPVTKAVSNTVKFATQLNLAAITAEQEMKKHIGRYKGCIFDDEDSDLFCYTVEEMVLRNLLWPFHLLTDQAELKKDQFYPLAYMMETEVLWKVFDALGEFSRGILGANGQIDDRRDRSVAEMNRQSDYRADHAPVEISGSIRRVGKNLEVYATARSTVTEGMRNADYQVNSLLATQTANREKENLHRMLLNDLEKKLLEVTGGFVSKFRACLKEMGDIIGENILRDTLCTDKINFRPHLKENAIKLIEDAPYEVDFYHVAYFLRFYDFSFDELFGDLVAVNIINDYVREKKIDTEDFYYKFYAYFYEVPHPIQREMLFSRLRGKLEIQTRKLCEKAKVSRPDIYNRENCDKVLAAIYNLTNRVPGLDAAHKKRLLDDAHYIFYDVLGDTVARDSYKEGNTPVFEY